MKTGPKPKNLPAFTVEFLRQILYYAPHSGMWFWLRSIGCRAKGGECAGARNARYHHIQIGGKKYATRSQNMANARRPSHNSSGLKGVTFHKRDRVFEAGIRIKGKTVYLGRFPTAKFAHAAYIKAAKQYFGEFARAR